MPPAPEEIPFDHVSTSGHQPRHRAAKAAYNAGRKGRGFSIDQMDVADMAALRELYEQGEADRARDRQQLETVRAESSSSQPITTQQPKTTELPPAAPAAPASAGNPPPRSRPARRAPQRALGGGAPQVVNDGAGFLLGLIGYALLINFLRGGRAQARGWIAAKFLNRPYGTAQPLPAQPAAPTGPTTKPSVYPAPRAGVGASIGAGATVRTA